MRSKNADAYRFGLERVLLTLRELRHTELPEAANLLARGMCNNPIIIRVFRISDTDRRARALERFFVPVVGGLHRRGLVCGAFCSRTLVGVCCMAPPGNCRPKLLEVLSMVRAGHFERSGVFRQVEAMNSLTSEWRTRPQTKRTDLVLATRTGKA